MKTAAIIIGHSHIDKGAANGDHNEFDYNERLASLMQTYLMTHTNVQPVIVYREPGGLVSLSGRVNQLAPDCAIELHLNAFNTAVTGCETLHVDSEPLAKALQAAAVGALKNRDRGAKKIKATDNGFYLLSHLNCPCVITEPFFIDNDQDLQNGLDHIDHLADAYCRAIVEFLDA